MGQLVHCDVNLFVYAHSLRRYTTYHAAIVRYFYIYSKKTSKRNKQLILSEILNETCQSVHVPKCVGGVVFV